jgi:hypothetical protein
LLAILNQFAVTTEPFEQRMKRDISEVGGYMVIVSEQPFLLL